MSKEEQLELPGIPPRPSRTRRNMHIDDAQWARVLKVARMLGTTPSDLYRQGGDLILQQKVAELKAMRARGDLGV